MPGGQGRMSGTPPPRSSPRRSHSSLTACQGPWRAGHDWWRVGTRLRRVLLRWQAPQSCWSRPGCHRGRGRWPYASGYASPYAVHPRTPSSAGGWITAAQAPSWGQSAAKPRPTGPPRGNRAARPQGALRAIDSSACPRSWRTCGPRRLRRHLSLTCCHARWCRRTTAASRHDPGWYRIGLSGIRHDSGTVIVVNGGIMVVRGGSASPLRRRRRSATTTRPVLGVLVLVADPVGRASTSTDVVIRCS
jgi:hypothetical protein